MPPRLRSTLQNVTSHCARLLSFSGAIEIALRSYWRNLDGPPTPYFDVDVFPLTDLLSSLSRISHSIDQCNLPFIEKHCRELWSFSDQLRKIEGLSSHNPSCCSRNVGVFDLSELKTNFQLLLLDLYEPELLFPLRWQGACATAHRAAPGFARAAVRCTGFAALPLTRACAVPALKITSPSWLHRPTAYVEPSSVWSTWTSEASAIRYAPSRVRAERPGTWMRPRGGMIGCQDVNGSAKSDEYNAIRSITATGKG